MTDKQRALFKAHAQKILAEHYAGKKLNNEALKWAKRWSDAGR